ncbi:Gfo/Idh/MocA family protein [Dietzia maris]|uniref:Gfo/Idh/MocA family protein n=1 Tax=Dietzia maris TaxID=37915 RepID=UPI0037CBBE07
MNPITTTQVNVKRDEMPAERLRIAVIGAGYWGPNLARNFAQSPDWDLAAVCDLDVERARAVADRVGAPFTSSLDEVLDDPTIHAIAIATPARAHGEIATAALGKGKHVVVEKPLADSRGIGVEMCDAAERNGLVLMADHTYCYTPAVLKIRELIELGEIGEILYIDSVRINLGLIQPDVDVLWDLAPHDLSILDFILPDGLDMSEVCAVGSDPLNTGKACVGYLTLPLGSGGIAHVHVNWLSPTKIRRMVIAGSLRTIVWDDLNPQQRISIYDRGIDLDTQSRTEANVTPATVSYRLGSMWAPALAEQEALANMATEFASAIRGRRAARTSGGSGLRVLSVLEAAAQSLARGGMPVAVEHEVPELETVL